MAKLSGLGGRLYRGETSVDFIGKRKIWYAFSGLLILASAVTLFTQGLHLGIEFKGGSSFTVTSPSASVSSAESAVRDAGVTTQVIVQKIGNDKVRVQTDALTPSEQSAVESKLAGKFSVVLIQLIHKLLARLGVKKLPVRHFMDYLASS